MDELNPLSAFNLYLFVAVENHIDWFYFKFVITNLILGTYHCLGVLLCFNKPVRFSISIN